MAPRNVFTKYLFAVKIAQLFSLFSPTVAAIHAMLLKVMAASNSGHLDPVMMYSPIDKQSLFARVKEFPAAVKFLSLNNPRKKCEFYLFYEARCDEWKTGNLPFLATEKAVFVPYFSSMSIPYKKWIKKLSTMPRYRFFISSESSHEETLGAFSSGLCQVVSVSPMDISAPVDRFRKCGTREIVPAFKLFDHDRGSKGYFPRGHRYVASVKPPLSMRPSFLHLSTVPEALALLDIYRALNNTLQFHKWANLGGVINKDLDIFVMPAQSSIFGYFFEYALYLPSRVCFFTNRRIAVQMSFMDS